MVFTTIMFLVMGHVYFNSTLGAFLIYSQYKYFNMWHSLVRWCLPRSCLLMIIFIVMGGLYFSCVYCIRCCFRSPVLGGASSSGVYYVNVYGNEWCLF